MIYLVLVNGVINKTKVLVVKNNIPVPKDIEETKKGPRLS